MNLIAANSNIVIFLIFAFTPFGMMSFLMFIIVKKIRAKWHNVRNTGLSVSKKKKKKETDFIFNLLKKRVDA